MFAGWAGGASEADEDKWAYTPWMPVRGTVATFAVELIGHKTVSLTWQVQTRKLESEAAPPTNITAATTVSTPEVSVVTSSLDDAEQLVRYRFNTGTGTANTTDYVHFRALQPSWQVDR